MKPTSAIIFAVLLSHPLIAGPTQESGQGLGFLPRNIKPTVGKAIGDADLKAKQKAVDFGGVATGEQRTKGWDLLEYSEVIGRDGVMTLLPKGAIIHAPESIQIEILDKPDGKYMPWPEFLMRYSALIRTVEVTIDQCSGTEMLSTALIESAIKSGQITVATLAGSPISVARKSIPQIPANTARS